MKGVYLKQNKRGAWLVYAGRELIFSSITKARALAFVESFT